MNRKRRWWRPVLWSLLVVVGTLAAYGFLLYATLSLPRAEDRPSLNLSSAVSPRTRDEDRESAFQERLTHLGYRPVSRKIQTPGEYRISGSSVDLSLRDFL